MEIKGEVYQFLSNKNIKDSNIFKVRVSPKGKPTVKFNFDFKITNKPIEINFAEIVSHNPSIGAFQVIDEKTDIYMQKRWPKCITSKITGFIPDDEIIDKDLIKNLLYFSRNVIWGLYNYWNVLKNIEDQLSTCLGYRREVYHHQMYDINGSRRPSSQKTFCETELKEFNGPGVATFENIDSLNEFFWSQIIPFPNRKSVAEDKEKIKEHTFEIKKHYNSYNELKDAEKYIDNNDIKGCIRSSASAIDAILRYYCRIWDVPFPKERIPFSDKIENILTIAYKPSYAHFNQDGSKKILYLYRARSSMHEGDCYYLDDQNRKIEIKSINEAKKFYNEALDFIMWIDSLV